MYFNDTIYTVNPTTGKWYHYVFTYLHEPPWTKQLYVDSVKNETGVLDPISNAYSGSGITRIGSTYSTATDDYANGYISNFKLYDRILTQSEITYSYNSLKLRYNQ